MVLRLGGVDGVEGVGAGRREEGNGGAGGAYVDEGACGGGDTWRWFGRRRWADHQLTGEEERAGGMGWLGDGVGD